MANKDILREKLYSLIEKLDKKIDSISSKDNINFYCALWDLRIDVLSYTAKFHFRDAKQEELQVFINRYNLILEKYEKDNELSK